MMNKKSGISLVVLVITIVVTIILAAAVIVNITDTNPINNAKITKVCTNFDNIKTDIALYINNAKIETKSYFTTTEILTGGGKVRKGINLESSKAKKNADGSWNAGDYKIIEQENVQYVNLNNGNKVEVYEILSDKYKDLINKLPETPTADAKWYIDINTNVYLVYENIDKIPKWLRAGAKGEKITDDTTLSMFLAVKTSDNIEYDAYDPDEIFDVAESGQLSIKSGVTIPSNLEIPSKIGEKIVSEIPEKCFSGKEELVSVKIPNTVQIIADEAFSNCTNLENVRISASVKEIDGRAFYNCTSLKEIVIPEGVESIGSDCFCNCTSIEFVSLPTTLKQIGNNFFNNTQSIKKVAIPQSVINDQNSVSSIFQSNRTVIDTVEFNGTIEYIGDRAFYELTNLKNVELPDTVVSIGNEAFRKCENFTSITIPASVNSIGTNAFADGAFKTIIFKGNIPDGKNWGATDATIKTEN